MAAICGIKRVGTRSGLDRGRNATWIATSIPANAGIIAENPARRDFEFYRAKDRAMVQEAEYGLMLWDGKSRGTLMNAVGLIRRGRPLVLYVAATRFFLTLRQPAS